MLYIVILTFKSVDETLQMKAIEQYFHVVLFIILYKVFLRSNLKCLTIQIKAIEQYFYVILLCYAVQDNFNF